MKKIYALKAVTDFLENGLVDTFKITKVQKVGFNDKEGSIYYVNVKIETVEGYKNKFVTFVINSSYLEDMDNSDDYGSETLEDRIEYLLSSYYAFN